MGPTLAALLYPGGNRRSTCSRIVRENLVRHATAAETLEEAQAVLLSAAEKRDQEPDDVIGAIRQALPFSTSHITMYRCIRSCGTTTPYFRTRAPLNIDSRRSSFSERSLAESSGVLTCRRELQYLNSDLEGIENDREN